MVTRGRKENVLNAYLADILKRSGIDALAEEVQPDGCKIDIRCVVGEHVVAIEAKQGLSPPQMRNAIHDANDRMVRRVCDVAVALVYPDGYATLDDLQTGEVKAVVIPRSFALGRKELTRAANTAKWRTFKPRDLAAYIRQSPNELGSPEALASDADVAVKSAAAQFTEEEAMSIINKMGSAARGTNLVGLMTDLLTAVMFHTKLDLVREQMQPVIDARSSEATFFQQTESERWPPKSVSECRRSNQIAIDLHEAHNLWLAVDYKQILEWSCAIINALPDTPSTNDALQILAKAAVEIQRTAGSQHHDLIGTTFCQSLENAQHDGSMYTTLPAAVLLTHLLFQEADVDWSNYGQVTDLRIVDFACGTGTLLIAAANYILHRESTGRKNEVAVALLEQMLHGFDVNNRAVFQTATGLGMIAPRVAFSKMHLYSLFLGIEPTEGVAKIGSLEMLEGTDQLSFNPRPATATRIDAAPAPVEDVTFNVAIMNPPFTRDSLRHDQFEREEEKALKSRENQLLAKTPVHRSGNANGFLVLADMRLDDSSGRMGFVMPTSVANNPSASKIRRMLAERFHIRYLIMSYDPNRFHCSGNTTIGEMLVILERRNGAVTPTTVVKLTTSPASASDAAACAASISEGMAAPEWGFVQTVERNKIEKGDWGALQFAHPELVRIAESSPWSRTLGSQLELIRTDPQGITERCDRRARSATPALYDHKEWHCNQLLLQPDTWIRPKNDNPRAEVMLRKVNRLKLPFRLSPLTQRLAACVTTVPTVGAAWYGAIPVTNGVHSREDLEKAACVVLNSTPGKVGMLAVRNNFKPSHFKLSMDGLRRMPMPSFYDLTCDQIGSLVEAFDFCARLEKKPFGESHECAVQLEIDKSVCAATAYDERMCDEARHLLAQEPMLTGEPYPLSTTDQQRFTIDDLV